jgi:hypothetical protein
MKFLILFLLAGCASFGSWQQQSDNLAENFTHDFSTLSPELGSSIGYREYDKLGTVVSNDIDEKELALLLKWQRKLKEKIKKTKDKDLLVDLELLLEKVNRAILGQGLDKKYRWVPFVPVSKLVFNNLFMLVNPQADKERKKAAVDRFKMYVNPPVGKALPVAYRDYIRNKIFQYEGKLFYPYKPEMEQYLKESLQYVNAIKGLLMQTGRDDWQQDYVRFAKLMNLYDSFVKNYLMKGARKNPQLPKEVYELLLANNGVDIKASDLIAIGKRDFKRIYKEFKQVALKVAKKNKLQYHHPAKVIQWLKKKQVTTPEKALALYKDANKKLEEIILDNALVSLPVEPMRIRLASLAESKAAPVPHVNVPPLVNNKGERPEFIVPTAEGGKLPFDDFSYAAAATILTAHEGRPGHDLQFSRMVEKPVSFIRARYGMNAVNIEGWALYAEDMVYPYISDEEKLVALQTRLWRVARYHLDPQVQLGLVSKKDVINVFHNKLGVSKVMAGLEYERFAYRNPAQATGYYHGLLKIRKLQKQLAIAGKKMDLRCFNDTFLSFGVMPPAKMLFFKEKFKSCWE